MDRFDRNGYNISEEDYDEDSFNVASATDYTGLEQTIPHNDAEMASYNGLYRNEAEMLTEQKPREKLNMKNSKTNNKKTKK